MRFLREQVRPRVRPGRCKSIRGDRKKNRHYLACLRLVAYFSLSLSLSGLTPVNTLMIQHVASIISVIGRAIERRTTIIVMNSRLSLSLASGRSGSLLSGWIVAGDSPDLRWTLEMDKFEYELEYQRCERSSEPATEYLPEYPLMTQPPTGARQLIPAGTLGKFYHDDHIQIIRIDAIAHRIACPFSG